MAAPHTIAIVATGPSVRPETVEADCIIAVNSAVELLRPDVWFSLDPSPANMRRIHDPVPGVRYVVAFPDRWPTPPYVERYERASEPRRGKPPEDGPSYWLWRWGAKCGLSERPGVIHSGNSAYGALGLAYHMRPSRIILHGVDATREPRVTGGCPRQLDHLPLLFASALPQLKQRGIEVVNASTESLVTCFS